MDHELPVEDQPDYRRFILFAFEPHDAGGGLDDVDSSHDSLGAAVARLEDICSRRDGWENLGYVVDRDTWKVVAHNTARYVVKEGSPGRVESAVFLNETPVTG